MRIQLDPTADLKLDRIERTLLGHPVAAGAAERYLREMRFILWNGDLHRRWNNLNRGLSDILRLYKVDVL